MCTKISNLLMVKLNYVMVLNYGFQRTFIRSEAEDSNEKHVGNEIMGGLKTFYLLVFLHFHFSFQSKMVFNY